MSGGRPVATDISYMGVHQRLKRQRGSARNHSCNFCPSPAAQWAYNGNPTNRVTGPYSKAKPVMIKWSTDLLDYTPLCVSCHRAFDGLMRMDHAAVLQMVAAVIRRVQS